MERWPGCCVVVAWTNAVCTLSHTSSLLKRKSSYLLRRKLPEFI